LDGLVKNIS
jgi:hypothetical protein